MTDSTKVKRKVTKGQTTIPKTVYRKLMIEQHEHHENAGDLIGLADSARHEIVLDTSIRK